MREQCYSANAQEDKMQRFQHPAIFLNVTLWTRMLPVFLALCVLLSANGMVHSAENSQQKTTDADVSNPLQAALQTGKPVVADFGKGTCVPCKMMAPILEDLQQEYKGKAEVIFIDIREHPSLTRDVGIRVIPTQIFYSASGQEVKRHTGFMDKSAIVQEIDALRTK